MTTLEEAKCVTPQARDLLLELKRIVQEVCPSASILLYGSVSKGTQTPESDYDLLILTEQRLSKTEEKTLERRIYDLELEREAVLSTLFCSREQWDSLLWRGSPLYMEIQKDGVTL